MLLQLHKYGLPRNTAERQSSDRVKKYTVAKNSFAIFLHREIMAELEKRQCRHAVQIQDIGEETLGGGWAQYASLGRKRGRKEGCCCESEQRVSQDSYCCWKDCKRRRRGWRIDDHVCVLTYTRVEETKKDGDEARIQVMGEQDLDDVRSDTCQDSMLPIYDVGDGVKNDDGILDHTLDGTRGKQDGYDEVSVVQNGRIQVHGKVSMHGEDGRTYDSETRRGDAVVLPERWGSMSTAAVVQFTPQQQEGLQQTDKENDSPGDCPTSTPRKQILSRFVGMSIGNDDDQCERRLSPLFGTAQRKTIFQIHGGTQLPTSPSDVNKHLSGDLRRAAMVRLALRKS